MKSWLPFGLGLATALVSLQVCGAAVAASFYASPGGQSSSFADVGIDGQGNITFSWETFHQATGDIIVQWRRRTAAGAFGPAEMISRHRHDNRFQHIAVNGAGATAGVWHAERGDLFTTQPVQGRMRSASGVLGPILTISPPSGNGFPAGNTSAYPDVELDAAGNATFTWTGRDTSSQNRAYARRRSAGGTFGPILTLSPSKVSFPKMAVNAAGAAVFVWVWNNGAGQNQIQARQLSAGGVLGPIKIIGQGIAASGGGAAGTLNPEVGVDSQGNALIVWEQPDGDGPCGINGCPKILSRTLSKTGVVGVVPQTFSTTESGGRLPQVAMAGNGNAVVAWLHNGLEYRTRSAAGALGPLRTFSTSASVSSPVLKGDAAGNTVAVWSENNVVRGRARSAAGVLGPIGRYAIAGQSSFGGALAVRAGGDAAVAWGQSDGLSGCSGPCNRIGGATNP